MKAFLCHASSDKQFALQVKRYLLPILGQVFCYEDSEANRENWFDRLQLELDEARVVVVFVGGDFTDWQKRELTAIAKRTKNPPKVMAIFIGSAKEKMQSFLDQHNLLTFDLVIDDDDVAEPSDAAAAECARKIVRKLGLPWRIDDDLPQPHMFSYEKHIIDFYKRKSRAERDSNLDPRVPFDIQEKILDGCPSKWPEVQRWEDLLRGHEGKFRDIMLWRQKPYQSQLKGEKRPLGNKVVAAALTTYHGLPDECLIHQGLCFPEAGPRDELYFPPLSRNNELRVAVLVSGGIAPGINAVIDGIVQRHWLYARTHNQSRELTIYGLRNGFRALDSIHDSYVRLAADAEHNLPVPLLVTSDHASEGGSMLGTSRVDELIASDDRLNSFTRYVNNLRSHSIDILYVIGGDGSMKASHSLFSVARQNPGRPLSVIAVPKTMDNDILWVWQAFGFLSAVEKAREIIEQLHTEVISNPRLCVLQLFGSDSGFVVSHSVLASATGHCDVALIPEVDFSMVELARVMKRRMCQRMQRIPYGLIVMAETAIPTDGRKYVAREGEKPEIDIGLSREEQDEIIKFDDLRREQKRIQGQTSDVLRAAGLKIVSRGLARLIPEVDRADISGFEPDWEKMRVFTNEPRHLLRAISPSCSDIIIGQRLGMLAVDNAMAGFTDFMISQWLTEYVLVPLKLVVFGRKRIPPGIFWMSVLAKTGQPENMVNP
ncbi:MAG: 6-phosphofructokinase [Acidobacteria bacterium]|nr:6-phosphofructokinase [Acidobacteriota bacterium]